MLMPLHTQHLQHTEAKTNCANGDKSNLYTKNVRRIRLRHPRGSCKREDLSPFLFVYKTIRHPVVCTLAE